MKKMTRPTTAGEITREWHLIDVKDQILGRSATKIAQLLIGKSKPYFANNMDCGDHVVVINAKEVATTGRKEDKKIYTRYSGYPSGLKKETLKHLRERKPEDIIKHAVSGMLPKNRLHDKMLSRLYIFANENHTYQENFTKEEAVADSK